MAKSPASHDQPGRTPALTAIGQLAKLTGRGAEPDLVVTAIAGIIEEWLAEGVDQDGMRERLEQLQADLDGGVEHVGNAEADAETDGVRKAVLAQKAALVAGRDAVTHALQKLAD